MAITEIVIPSLKQDESTRSKYQETIQPLAKIIGSAPGTKSRFIAPILTENGVNVQSAVKYAVGLGNYSSQLIEYLILLLHY